MKRLTICLGILFGISAGAATLDPCLQSCAQKAYAAYQSCITAGGSNNACKLEAAQVFYACSGGCSI